MNKQCNLNKHDSYVVVLQHTLDDNTKLLCKCSHFLHCFGLGGRDGGQFLFANQCVLFNLLLYSRLSTQSRMFGSLFHRLATLPSCLFFGLLYFVFLLLVLLYCLFVYLVVW